MSSDRWGLKKAGVGIQLHPAKNRSSVVDRDDEQLWMCLVTHHTVRVAAVPDGVNAVEAHENEHALV
jgi:hypothetical protein